MKKITLCVGAALLMLNATSCKKDDKKNDQKDLLIGVWKTDYQSYDKNHNGTIEEDEKKPATSNETTEFRADGKMILMEDGNADTTIYTRNGVNLVVGEGEDAEPWVIKTLDANKLVLTDVIERDGVATMEEMGFKR
jgi:hypothetical protein